MKKALYRAFIPPTWPGRIYYATFCVFLLVMAWQATDRTPPAQVLEREAVTTEVQAGGTLFIRNKMTRARNDSEISIHRILYDGFNLRFEYGVQTLPAGSLTVGEEVYFSQVPISPVAAPGQAHLDTTACWARTFNLIHQIWPVCVPLKTINFTILPAN